MKRSLRSWLWRVPRRSGSRRRDRAAPRAADARADRRAEWIRTRRASSRWRGWATSRCLKETCVNLGRKRDREMRIGQWLEELRHDVKFAFRQLRRRRCSRRSRRSRWRSASAPTARSSRWSTRRCCGRCRTADPDRLVTIWETSRRQPRSFASPPNMLDWNGAQPHVREDRRLHAERRRHGDGRPRRQRRDGVAAMGDGRHLRRARRQADCRPHVPPRGRSRSAASVIVMSEALWESRFNRDPAIVGQEIKLDGDSVDGRRRRAAGASRSSAAPACGRCGRSLNLPPRARGHTCCRWSAG